MPSSGWTERDKTRNSRAARNQPAPLTHLSSEGSVPILIWRRARNIPGVQVKPPLELLSANVNAESPSSRPAQLIEPRILKVSDIKPIDPLIQRISPQNALLATIMKADETFQDPSDTGDSFWEFLDFREKPVSKSVEPAKDGDSARTEPDRLPPRLHDPTDIPLNKPTSDSPRQKDVETNPADRSVREVAWRPDSNQLVHDAPDAKDGRQKFLANGAVVDRQLATADPPASDLFDNSAKTPLLANYGPTPDSTRDDVTDDDRLEHFNRGDPKYNYQDCRADKQLCQDAIAALRNHPVGVISLDITPSFRPESDDSAESHRARDEKLKKSPSRQWHNASGEIIAEGRLRDYRNGKIYIETEDGDEKVIRYLELGNDELCFVAGWWEMPAECLLGEEELRKRNWPLLTLNWKASGLCHKPLYFEERSLERYGHALGPVAQPLLSGAHFFGSALTLPYQMGIHPPLECQYVLGYYRPGSCAPYLVPPIPLSIRGALAQTGAILGLLYAVP